MHQPGELKSVKMIEFEMQLSYNPQGRSGDVEKELDNLIPNAVGIGFAI